MRRQSCHCDEADERGQILVLVVGSIVVLLAVVALVIDGGFAFFYRRDAQNVSDLTALAGTKVVADANTEASGGGLARTATDVDSMIGTKAQENGCLSTDDCSWTAWFVNGSLADISQVVPGNAIPTVATGVRVEVHNPAPTILAGPVLRLLGLNGVDVWDVRTTATAVTAKATLKSPGGQMLPIALREEVDENGNPTTFNPGQEYVITDEELNEPGNFGWLDWPPNRELDAPTLTTSVCEPDNPSFTLPIWIDGSTGVKNQGGMSGAGIAGCLNYYLDNGIPVLVPIYGTGCEGSTEAIKGEGANTEYCIVGVAAMVLTEVNWGPTVKSIKGYFLEVYAYSPDVVPPGAGVTHPGGRGQVLLHRASALADRAQSPRRTRNMPPPSASARTERRAPSPPLFDSRGSGTSSPPVAEPRGYARGHRFKPRCKP